MSQAEEVLGTSNGAEAHRADMSLTVNEPRASSSSAPREYQDSASDEPSAGEPVTPAQPMNTTDVSGSKPRREKPRDYDDDNNLDKLAKLFLGLFFQAAFALMIFRVQPQPQKGDSSTNLSSLSSIQFKLVWATTLFGFAFIMLGTRLRNHHRKVAYFCSYAGVFLGALDFFLMLSIFADESLYWLVWGVCSVVVVVFACTLAERWGYNLTSSIAWPKMAVGSGALNLLRRMQISLKGMAKKRRFTTCETEQHAQPSLSQGSPNCAQSCGASQPTQPHGSSQTTHLPKEWSGRVRGCGFGPTPKSSRSTCNEFPRFNVADEEERMRDKQTIHGLQCKVQSQAAELSTLKEQMAIVMRHVGLQVQDSCNGSLDQISPQAHQGSSHASHDIEYSN